MDSSLANLISNFVPVGSEKQIYDLVKQENLIIKIKNERKTRHGDYRLLPTGQHQITINSNLNRYKFLITLIHEIAHLSAYKRFGISIKPHGKEWKYTFKTMMLPFINPSIFPDTLLKHVANHFKNPKASSDRDLELSLALKEFDPISDKVLVMNIEEGDSFQLYNGKVFKRGLQRRKRIECTEQQTGKVYLFNPLAEVDLIE